MYEAGVDPVFSRGVCALNLHFLMWNFAVVHVGTLAGFQ